MEFKGLESDPFKTFLDSISNVLHGFTFRFWSHLKPRGEISLQADEAVRNHFQHSRPRGQFPSLISGFFLYIVPRFVVPEKPQAQRAHQVAECGTQVCWHLMTEESLCWPPAGGVVLHTPAERWGCTMAARQVSGHVRGKIEACTAGLFPPRQPSYSYSKIKSISWEKSSGRSCSTYTESPEAGRPWLLASSSACGPGPCTHLHPFPFSLLRGIFFGVCLLSRCPRVPSLVLFSPASVLSRQISFTSMVLTPTIHGWAQIFICSSSFSPGVAELWIHLLPGCLPQGCFTAGWNLTCIHSLSPLPLPNLHFPLLPYPHCCNHYPLIETS